MASMACGGANNDNGVLAQCQQTNDDVAARSSEGVTMSVAYGSEAKL